MIIVVVVLQIMIIIVIIKIIIIAQGSMSIKFLTQQTNQGDIQTRDTTNIQNTDGKKNEPARRPWQKSCWNQKWNTQRDWTISKHGVICTTENELAGISISKLCAGQATKTQKWMYSVPNSETMLKCKINRWRPIYLTWSIGSYQNNHFNFHAFRTKITVNTALCTNNSTAALIL